MDIFYKLSGGCCVSVGIIYTQGVIERKNRFNSLLAGIVSGSYIATGINFIIGNAEIGGKLARCTFFLLLSDLLLNFKLSRRAVGL